MRIAVTISYTKNWKELAEITIPNTAEYCLRHGYSLFVTVEEEYPKYTGLEKLSNIKKLLIDFEVVYSLDCDCIITNHATKLEDFITKEDDFFICEGWNMGIFAVRTSAFGVELIDFMLDKISNGYAHCEQDAISLFSHDDKHISVWPHPAFNSYLSELYPDIPQPVTAEQGQWKPGQFICHLPALSMETRISKMKELKEKIVR